MSDAKWVRLLEVLVQIRPRVESCRVKLVWDEVLREMWIPSGSSLGFDYYPQSMEGMISGTPRGFYSYKELEWVEFQVAGEEAEALKRQIGMAGQFELAGGESGLRLYAYR